MTAEYNGTDKRAELIGDGTGWQRMKSIELEAPPAGTNQVIYVMRFWGDFTSDFTETVAHAASCYLGFSFTGNHIETSDSTNTEYDDFFGIALQDASGFDKVDVDHDSNPSDGSSSLGDSSQNTVSVALSGNGTNLDSDVSPSSNTNKPWTLPVEGIKDKITIVWRVYTSLVDDSVNYEAWWNSDSINLDSFDFSSINQDSPETQIPIWGGSTYYVSGTIHGDTTGTNWRPSSGIMAFPTHFLARWGGTSKGIYVSHVVPVYGRLTT